MSTAAGVLETRESTRGLGLVLGLLGLVVLLFAANFGWITVQGNRDAAYIARSTEIQVLSGRLSKFASEAASGNFDAFDSLKDTKDIIERDVHQLEVGDPKPYLFLLDTLPASPLAVQEPLVEVRNLWNTMSKNADSVLARNKLVVDLGETAGRFQADIPRLQKRTDEVIRILISKGAPGSQVYIASQQLVLADRMLRRINEVLQGGAGALTAADSFSRDAQRFEQVLSGLLNGDKELGIRPIEDRKALAILGDMFKIFDAIRGDVEKILSASSELFEVREAADDIFLDSEDLLAKAKALADAYGNLAGGRIVGLISGVVLGFIAVMLLILVASIYSRGSRERAQVTEEINQRNQEAIMRLLDEMGSLAEGDLTVQATVTEDITGAIADSVNFAIEALRSLVTTINETALQVASAAQETQSTAMHLAEAAEHQAQEITTVGSAVTDMAHSIDAVSKNAADPPMLRATRCKSRARARRWCAKPSRAWIRSASRSRRLPNESNAWAKARRKSGISLN